MIEMMKGKTIHMSEFKDMLKYFRMRDNLSQSELAEKLGIAPSTISMYEVGKREPDFETEEKIADFFNTDLNTLRGHNIEPSSYNQEMEKEKKNNRIEEESFTIGGLKKKITGLNGLTKKEKSFLNSLLVSYQMIQIEMGEFANIIEEKEETDCSEH